MTTGVPSSILVCSSHVVRGAVGNRACVFAIETLGARVFALPTVHLSWHPGHGPSTRKPMDDDAFESILSDLTTGPFAGEIGAVLTGYLGSAKQAAMLRKAIDTLREANASLKVVCDPVIGDVSGLYVPEETAMAIRDYLLPAADLATPNRFELAWLAGRDVPETTDQAIECAAELKSPHVLVTSAPAMMRGMIGNLLVSGDNAWSVEHRIVANAPNGTGDLMAALMLGRMVGGQAPDAALPHAAASVYDVVLRAHARGIDELALHAEAMLLRQPQSNSSLRQLRVAKRSPKAQN